MKTILLLRGVNIGGVRLQMAGLRQMLADLGLGAVRSYIQSGNLVFDDPGLPDLQSVIAAGLKDRFGLVCDLFFYAAPDYETILAECPYAAEGDANGASVHVFFLAGRVVFDHVGAGAFATTERIHLTPRAMYLHAPDGIGRSVFVEKLGRFLKARMTARNWNTARALSEMAKI